MLPCHCKSFLYKSAKSATTRAVATPCKMLSTRSETGEIANEDEDEEDEDEDEDEGGGDVAAPGGMAARNVLVQCGPVGFVFVSMPWVSRVGSRSWASFRVAVVVAVLSGSTG